MHLPQHQTLQRKLWYGETSEDDPGLLVQIVSTHESKYPLCLLLVVLLDVISAGITSLVCADSTAALQPGGRSQCPKPLTAKTSSSSCYLSGGGKHLEINFCTLLTLSDIHSMF